MNPYALVFRWGWWYVVGYCLLRQEMRSFRLDRIEALQLTVETFQIPAGFDIYAYLDEEWRSQPQIQVKLRFAPQAAHVALTNRSYWDKLEEQSDGTIIVSLTTPDLNWAASSALAYGPFVTVLEPEVLRKMVADWARAIAALYDGIDRGPTLTIPEYHIHWSNSCSLGCMLVYCIHRDHTWQ